MTRTDLVVVGGGIAGLAVAERVTQLGGGRVLLLERETQLATHASGRNAAIFRPLDTVPGFLAAAARSRALLDEQDVQWFRGCGLVLVAPDETPFAALAPIARRVAQPGALQPIDVDSALPFLADGPVRSGLLMGGAGVIDIHAVTTSLANSARGRGAIVRTGAEVRRIRVAGGRVLGVDLSDGETVSSEAVVLAAGAWAGDLGVECGAPLPLRSLRRHLAHVDLGVPLAPDLPVVWRVDEEVYFRPEAGAVLASPCDADPAPPGIPAVSAEVVATLADKLGRLSGSLRPRSVRRAWACLRTFASDDLPVVGPDPRIRGLFWCAGLGGHGMTAGLAAGEAVATAVSGREVGALAMWDPARLVSS